MSRPYKITPTLAMDLDNILSIEMIESPNKKGTYQIIICMLYIDPIVLDFPNVMAARTKFSEIFEEWKSTKLSESTEAHIRKLVCSEVNELLDILKSIISCDTLAIASANSYPKETYEFTI